jgi:hypothetical protein
MILHILTYKNTYKNNEREHFVIGMEEMNSRHKAENIQVKVEEILNQYEFDKSKIVSIVTDEGSNFLKLFSSLENELLCIISFYLTI